MLKLHAPRLILREHRMDDLPTHHALFSDAKVMRYLPELMTHSCLESEKNLRDSIAQLAVVPRKCCFLRIEERDTGAHVGEIGYTIEKTTPLGTFANMGYFIWDTYWGRGYTAEAARALMRHGFEEDGVYRFSAGCLKENVGSERVMIKCGMIKEAEFVEYQWHEGQLKDRVEYRLLKGEWI